MRRFRVPLSVVAVVLLGVLALTAQPVAIAQEGTPSAEMSMEGLTFTLLGVVEGAPLHSPADVQVARTGFDPGASFPFDASDPTGTIVVVEAGALTVHVEEQAWTISRGGALQQAMASMETPGAEPDMTGVLEEVAMGAEATVEAGDVAYIPGGVSGEVRNAGEEHAEALVVIIAPQGMMMGEATPAP